MNFKKTMFFARLVPFESTFRNFFFRKNKNVNFKKTMFFARLVPFESTFKLGFASQYQIQNACWDLGPLVGSFTTCVWKLTSRNVMSL